MGGECDTYGREEKCVQRFLLEQRRERDHVEGLALDGGNTRILKGVLKKWDERERTGLLWLDIGQVADCCEHGNEPSSLTNCEKFLHYLRKYYLHEKD